MQFCATKWLNVGVRGRFILQLINAGKKLGTQAGVCFIWGPLNRSFKVFESTFDVSVENNSLICFVFPLLAVLATQGYEDYAPVRTATA